MEKKTNITAAEQAPESPVLPVEPVQEGDPPQQPPETEATPVRYRVGAPGGLHLRDGPGRAYRSLTVLPAGELVLGDDVAELLRADRSSGDSAWMMVLSKAGSGWVDGAYLERLDESAE